MAPLSRTPIRPAHGLEAVTPLDAVRAAYPHLGFAVYAYDPGGPVTLEIHDGGTVFTFRAATEAEAVALAFPAALEPAPADLFE